MKHFLTLLSHEIRMLLVSPSTYIAAVLFLGIMGFIFTGILESYSKTPQDVSPAHVFFQLFWLPVLFMVPMLTMKCLAEERRLGTIETLLTTPVTTTEVVLGQIRRGLSALSHAVGLDGRFLLHPAEIRRRRALPRSRPAHSAAISSSRSPACSSSPSACLPARSPATRPSPASSASRCCSRLIFGLRFLADVRLAQPRGAAAGQGGRGLRADLFPPRRFHPRASSIRARCCFYLSGTVLALIFSILGVEAKLLHS